MTSIQVLRRQRLLLLGGAVLSLATFSFRAPAATAVPPRMSADANRLVEWIIRSGDHAQLPFMLVDKREARLWVFDGRGTLSGTSPILLGLAHGDDSVPGIGERPIRDIRPEERTTPAGRFIVEPGQNSGGEDILWIDYDAAVSMHRVRPTNPVERRLERLASPTTTDNRISYGCINVPAAFYNAVVSPRFAQGPHGIAYVLPETRPLPSVFNIADSARGTAADRLK